jgi:hypothetical protein
MRLRQGYIAARGEQRYTTCEAVPPVLRVPVNLRDKGNASPLQSALICRIAMEGVMLATPNSQAEAALQQLAEQFTHWRQSRRTP